MEADLPQAAGRTLVEEEIIVLSHVHARHIGVLLREEEVIGHELDDQGDVDVHRAFQLRQGPDVTRRHLEVGVGFEPLAAITSHSRLMTSSPWVVTFILTIGL